MLLRGCFLRNTPYAIGIVIYVGPESKIMKNMKKPPTKVSNMMKKMNYMLYSVFILQIALILIYSIAGIIWDENWSTKHTYL
jgi:phospholipid-translocating ATPase